MSQLNLLVKDCLNNPTRFAVALTNGVNERFKNCEPWKIIVVSSSTTFALIWLYNKYNDIDTDVYSHFKRKLFRLIRKIPAVKSKIDEELNKTRKGLEEDILKSNKGISFLQKLPTDGVNIHEINNSIDEYIQMCDTNWKDGAVSACVFGADEEVTKLCQNIFQKFIWHNAMHTAIFPDTRKMEAEVVRMVCDMFNGDSNTCGTMTTGGTESILLACKAYRDLARKKGIKKPEMIVPSTAHGSFYKAAEYFNIRVVKVPTDPVTKKALPKLMKKHINSNTCLLVGSATTFPYGVIDPIDEIAEIGHKYGIPVHVDACFAGFLIPFMADAGYKTPLFDFRLPGVTSISCDTHKYGYSPKGSSVILYRNLQYRENQYFSISWSGGIYAAQTMVGSKPGSTIAMTWAIMQYYGRKGYVDITRKIVETSRYIASEIKKIDGLRLMVESEVSIVSFDSDRFNAYRILDEMSHNWHLNALQDPPGVQLGVTKLHTQDGVADRFIKDLREAVSRIMKNPNEKLGAMAQIYCSSKNVPDKSLLNEVANIYLDTIYNTNIN